MRQLSRICVGAVPKNWVAQPQCLAYGVAEAGHIYKVILTRFLNTVHGAQERVINLFYMETASIGQRLRIEKLSESIQRC